MDQEVSYEDEKAMATRFLMNCDVIGDLDFEDIENEIYDTSRWHTWHYVIVQCKKTARFWAMTIGRPAGESNSETEYMDESAYEVLPEEKKIIVYIPGSTAIQTP